MACPTGPTTAGEKTPSDYTYGSHFEAWWQSPRYKTHVWQARIASQTLMLAGCLSCARAEGKGVDPRSQPAGPAEVIDLPSAPSDAAAS